MDAGSPQVRLFTLGYENLTVGGLVAVLDKHGIRRLVDVRDRPYSRKPGFSAMPLFEALRKAGIAYEPGFGLGNPEDIRALWKNGDMERGKRLYEKHLNNGGRYHVDHVISLASLGPTCLLCLEEDPDRCHRSIIARTAQSVAPRLTVEHVRP